MMTITPPLSGARADPPAPTTEIKPAVAPTTRPAAAQATTTPASGAPAQVNQVTVDLPEITAGKLHLSVDDETGRVVGRIIDRESGELLWQVPSDDMLRLIAATEKMLGPIYSTEA